MRIITSAEHTENDTERLVRRIPFFNDVYESSATEFHTLMSLSDIMLAEPGEIIIRKGDTDMYLYFLLKGQLNVYLDDNPNSTPINMISPGEVFGVLSMMTRTPRSAFIRADAKAKKTLLFRLDYGHMTDSSTLSKLSLQTKLIFYRMALHNIRWTLEMNKMSDPKHYLVEKIRKLPFINVSKGTREELDALKQQAISLSDILFEWNSSKSKQSENNK